MGRTQRILRTDYRAPDFRVDQVRLDFDIRERTTVSAELDLVRAPGAPPEAPLVLPGRGLELLDVALDGAVLGAERYTFADGALRVAAVPDRFTLRLRTRIDPERNTSLEGLFRSGRMLCTQCEAHGFSRITCYPDRPDVSARFRVRIEADAARYPVLLSNGNRVEAGAAGPGRHFVVWDDPFPKPCYLFALVAGDLACVEDTFTTRSGRTVQLRFYVDPGNEPRVPHAMDSLKRAMRWDEETYGLEYDLDTYMVVAARDFNMGAMENKGLNLFNAAYVLASPETATDADYEGIEAVIGHEYFHNWTGNRVTCRDWFQLSLKEGLTVFREQQFAAACGSPGVKRIQQVRSLRARQFPEDAGPLAHPVRPEAYLEVNNFYTATVYEKGAEVIRMLATLAGPERFAAGVRGYLEAHDGGAATIEDFIAAHERSSGLDLSGFARWYGQAGTPEVEATDAYDAGRGAYRLRLRQRTPPTPGQRDKAPVPVPVRIALRGAGGRLLEFRCDAPEWRAPDLILLEAESVEVRFEGLRERPVPVLLRGFSAPVKLRYDHGDGQLAAILRHDDDPFARWEAGQQLMLRAFEQALGGAPPTAGAVLVEALQQLAAQPPEDKALLAELLRLPAAPYVVEHFAPSDPLRVADAHDALRQEIAAALTGPLSVWVGWAADGRDAAAAGRRALANLAAWYLAATGAGSVLDLCRRRALEARNMTLVYGALAALKDVPGAQREDAMAGFLRRCGDDDLLLDKWFGLQAAARHEDGVAQLRTLLAHERFDLRYPNRAYAVLGGFSRANLRAFHARGGAGYALLAEQVLRLDPANPQVAARVCEPLLTWRRLPEPWAGWMRARVEDMAARPALSPDLREKVEKALEAEP